MYIASNSYSRLDCRVVTLTESTNASVRQPSVIKPVFMLLIPEEFILFDSVACPNAGCGLSVPIRLESDPHFDKRTNRDRSETTEVVVESVAKMESVKVRVFH